MINYNSAYTTKKEILDIAILNARVRNINSWVKTKASPSKRIQITQSQYDNLYNRLMQQMLGTMKLASADLSYSSGV